ncbi:MAG: carbohydrate ABC transporter permease [Anaerolineales bacterium]|jgi:inositol-phosphate transport system permease protein|nr:carbohydrate ABC transporter permease [Desulfobacterales bacterium]
MEDRRTNWPLTIFLLIVSAPIIIMYLWLFIDSISEINIESIWPQKFTLKNWRFLTEEIAGHGSVWTATLNTIIFATSVVTIVVVLSSTAGYALSRLKFPFRSQFLGFVLLLHSFPSVTLIISIFLMLRMIGLYDTLIGVILVKAALELPFGIWIMKGFYDTVPWEIEMAGLQDGASRFQVWYKLVLPQIMPGVAALAIFSFMAGWSEFVLPLILAPSSDARLLSVYLAGLMIDDYLSDFGLFKAVGLFYVVPVMIFYLFTQDKLMNIYGGGTKG